MSELPEGWAVARVDEVGHVQLGRQRSPKYHSGDNMRPYLRVANVYEDRIDLDDVMEMHFEPAEVERYELHVGDVLLNEGQSKELVGRPAMYRGELPGVCFTNSLVRFQASEAVDPRFSLQLFRFWLKHGDFQKIAKITTNIAHLGAGRFAAMSFPVPPLNEQRRIVAKIEALQERSRAAREALEAIPPLLDRFRQSVLAAAFRGDLTADWRAKNPNVEPASVLLDRIRQERRRRWEEDYLAKAKAKGKEPKNDKWKAKYKEPTPVDAEGLPDLPEGWCWAALEELATRITDGTHQAPPTTDDGVPFIGIRNIAGWEIDWSTTNKWVSKETHAQLTQRCPPLVGDILYAAVGATFGRAVEVTWEHDFVFQRHIAHIKPVRVHLSPTFLSLALNAPNSYAQARAVARGAAQPTVTLGDLSRIVVPLAPQAEQTVVCKRIRLALSKRRMLQGATVKTLASCAKLNQSILAKAFRGDLVPQDPNDEPASALLERIRVEREAAASKKNSRGGRSKKGKNTPAKKDAEPAPQAACTREVPQFMSLVQDDQLGHIWDILLGEGSLERDAAIRHAADKLRDEGAASFKRLRKGGKLYTAIAKAIELGLEAAQFDEPESRHVRAVLRDADEYQTKDWKKVLENALSTTGAGEYGTIPTALRWAMQNMGLEYREAAGNEIECRLRAIVNTSTPDESC